jgi:tetratricopeptide (TPR) repeat protein
MSLTHSQKKYLKKALRRLSLNQIANDLGVSERELLSYLKSYWDKEKYQKYMDKQESLVQVNGKETHPRQELNFREFLTHNWPALAFLSFLVFVVYFNSLFNEFVSDDIATIAQNQSLGDFTYIFSRPLSMLRPLFYFITYKISDLNPLFFRLINIVFHLGNVWTIYTLLFLMINRKVAFFTAGIFAVHPILTESITWISGGPYAQYSFFLLLAFFLFFLSLTNPKFYIPSILAFLLSLFSSERVVVFPLILLAFEFAHANWQRNWKKLLPFFLLSGIWGVFSIMGVGQRLSSLETTYYQQSDFNNPLIQIPIAVSSYLVLIFWPKNLTLYHSEMSFNLGEYFFRVGIFLLLLAAIAYFLKKDHRVFFWLSFFLISLLPTLTPLPISWIVAERYVYLGSLGIFVVIALAIQTIGQFVKEKRVSYLILAVIIVLLSFRTILRNGDWQNQDTLWLATAKTSPSSPQNHNNLGDYYGRHGNLERAAEEFKKAIELNPHYGDAYHNLANVYRQMGKTDYATENYQKALSLNPNLWQSYQNLAAIYFEQGKYDLSLEFTKKALKINPQDSNLYTILGIVYSKIGVTAEAKEQFQKAIQLDPNNQKAKQLMLNIE